MTRELIFHLGDRKTGSTSIQAMLRSGRWEAEGAPKLGYPARLNNGGLASSLTGGNPVGNSAEGFKLLAKRMSVLGDDIDITVVSSEHFEVVPPRNLKVALQAHMPQFADSARFVMYLRPHADRILSSFAERTKLGVFTGPLSEFVDNSIESGLYHYLDRVRRWKKVFGDRFVVRPMLRSALHQNCVVRDFLSIALRTDSLKLLQEPAANESMTVRDLSIITLFHREFTAVAKNDKSRQAIGRNMGLLFASLRGEGGIRPAYDRTLCEKVIVAHREDASLLDSEFFTGSPMLSALESMRGKTVETVPSLIPEDNFAPGELRDLQVLAKMICRMAEIDMEGWVEFFTGTRVDEEDGANPFNTENRMNRRKQRLLRAETLRAELTKSGLLESGEAKLKKP